MADESQAAVLEKPSDAASPTGATSPAGGLGADAQEQPTQQQPDEVAKLRAELQKHQARADRAERRMAAAEDAHAQAVAQLGETVTVRQIRDYERGAPDPTLDPEGAVRYWQGVTYDVLQSQRAEAAQQTVVQRTERWITEKLAELKAETGVAVARNDERLVLEAGKDGRRKFLASLERIKADIGRSKETDERIKAEARKLAEQELKKYGVDKFDAGEPSGGGGEYAGCPTTLSGIKALTPEQYARFAPRIKELWAEGKLRKD